MGISIRELSKLCGVSVSAVSQILNDKNVRVTEATRQKVKTIAKENNYVPNRIAQGLVTKKTNTIGLIIPDIANTFFAESAKQIEKALQLAGYSLFLCNANNDAELEKKYIDLLLSHSVDGLIFCCSMEALEGTEVFAKIQTAKIPCVLFDRYLENAPFPIVSIDNISGGKLATKHLIDSGHKKIGCIAGALVSQSGIDRLNGYKFCLEENGIEVDKELIFIGNYDFQSGYEGCKILLKKGVSAIFASNDLMAYGVLKACTELAVPVPTGLSVVGFDDLFTSSIISVPLTTVHQNVEILAKAVSKTILNMISGEEFEKLQLILPKLVERDSVWKKL